MGFKDDWAHATPYLLFCVAVFACGDLIFGTDTSTFGSLQALPSWVNHFGDTTTNGKPALSTYAKSIANSVMFIGRLLGCTTFEPVVERTGFKWLIIMIAVLQVIAVVVQLTANTWQVFTVGRVIAYLAVGYIENTVPVYSAEAAPAALRGFCAGLLTPVITMSSVWGAGMCQAYATETGKIGWMVPIGVQAIPAVMLFILVPFTVESPRWLLTHGKKDKAISALTRLRPKSASESGQVAAEIEAIYLAVEFDKENATARWRDLCHGNYLRRAIYSALLFWFYQTTGNSFYNAYGPTFFVSVGLGSKSFTYATVVQLVGAIGAFMAIFLTDRIGRRPLILTGGTLLILFNSTIAGFGSSSTRTDTTNNIVVASFILMLWSTKISWATHCYMVSSELGGIRMRKKIMMVGTTVDLFAAWLVSFTSPYIMNYPYGNIGGRIGFVWAGMAILALIFGIFWVPELRGRSLEEVDELFETPRWGWQYSKVRTSGVGAAVARLEGGRRTEVATKSADVEASPWESKGDTVHVEDMKR